MGVFIGIALLLFGGGFFARQVRSVPQSAWTGPRTAAQKQRGAVKPRSVRQEIRLTWEKARAQDWQALRAHERKTGTGHAAVAAPATPVTGTVLPPLQRARAAAQARFAPRPAAGGNGTTSAAPAAPPRTAGAPTSASPAPNGSPGRNTPVAATGSAVEQFVEGVNQIHAHAQAGGLHAKHGAVKAAHEGCVRFAAMSAMLSRAMSEPGQNYGPEITEGIAKAATHLRAAAMAFSESDGGLTTLENMTVGELAQSSRQAPHHSQLTESGSH